MPSVASASVRKFPRKRKVDGDDDDLATALCVKKKLKKACGGTVSAFIKVPENKKEAVDALAKKEQTIKILRGKNKTLEGEVATSVRDFEICDRFCYLLLKEMQLTAAHLQAAYNKLRPELEDLKDIYSVSELINELDVDGLDTDKLEEGYNATA